MVLAQTLAAGTTVLPGAAEEEVRSGKVMAAAAADTTVAMDTEATAGALVAALWERVAVGLEEMAGEVLAVAAAVGLTVAGTTTTAEGLEVAVAAVVAAAVTVSDETTVTTEVVVTAVATVVEVAAAGTATKVATVATVAVGLEAAAEAMVVTVMAAAAAVDSVATIVTTAIEAMTVVVTAAVVAVVAAIVAAASAATVNDRRNNDDRGLRARAMAAPVLGEREADRPFDPGAAEEGVTFRQPMMAAANRPVRMAGGRRSGRLPLHRHDGVTTVAKITMTMTAVLEGCGSRRSMKRCQRSLVQIDTEKGKQEEIEREGESTCVCACARACTRGGNERRLHECDGIPTTRQGNLFMM